MLKSYLDELYQKELKLQQVKSTRNIRQETRISYHAYFHPVDEPILNCYWTELI